MSWIDNHANALSALGSISSALVAVVASIIAAFALKYSRQLLEENRILRLSGSDPEIIPYLTIDENVTNCLNIAVENVGSGPAFDVIFEVMIDDKTWKGKNIILKKEIGKIPFTAIPAGNKIETTFAMGFNVLSEPVLSPFDIAVEYKSIRGLPTRKIYMIDVRQFENIGKFKPENEMKKLGDALKTIANNIAKISK